MSAVQLTLALTLAVVFAVAALHKFTAGKRFEAQLAAYRLLPVWSVGLAARLLAGVEVLLAVTLMLPQFWRWSGLVAAAILLLYCVAIGVNLARGRSDIDCGCGDRPQPLSGWLLLRNGLLAAAAGYVGLGAAAAGRADLLVALPGSATLVLIYTAFEQVLANTAAQQRPRDMATEN